MATTKTTTGPVRFPLRIPRDVHTSLGKIAEKNRRSLHSEILVAIDKHIEEHRQILGAAREETSS